MIDPLIVRRAHPGDLVTLAALWQGVDALHARIAPGFFAHVDPGEPSAAALRRVLGSSDAAVLVADDAGEVVGCVHVELYDTPALPGMLKRRRAHVERIMVTPACRRRGVGRRLMAEAAAWGVARGATQLLLTVWNGNEAAERFYRALGYAPVSRVLARDLP